MENTYVTFEALFPYKVRVKNDRVGDTEAWLNTENYKGMLFEDMVWDNVPMSEVSHYDYILHEFGIDGLFYFRTAQLATECKLRWC